MLRATTACTFSTCQLPKVVQEWCAKNELRATMACIFSTSQLPKLVREWCVLYILTRKCASRHNGVQLFISHLASWLRTCRFSEPAVRPTNHWKKHCVSRLSYFFAHLDLLPSDFLFFDLLSSSLLFSDSSHLCFSSVHVVGSLTSKLPSIISSSRFGKPGGPSLLIVGMENATTICTSVQKVANTKNCWYMWVHPPKMGPKVMINHQVLGFIMVSPIFNEIIVVPCTL